MCNRIKNKGFFITIGSLPDRDYLVATISYQGKGWVEINHEQEDMQIQFYPHPEQPYWEFNLDDALEALAEAKKKLVAMGPKN